MDNNITKTIIAGIIIGLLVLGGSVIWSIYKNSTSKSATDGIGITTVREINQDEVEKHNVASDCWVILGGVVYDGTSTISNNPDNKALLASVCGKDGTSVYSVLKYKKQELSSQEIQKLGDQLTAYQLGILAP